MNFYIKISATSLRSYPLRSPRDSVRGGWFFSWSPHRAVSLRVPLPWGFGRGGGEGFGLVPRGDRGAT